MDAGVMNPHAYALVLLEGQPDEMSHVLSSCFPSDAMQFQEEMNDTEGLLLAWHFNLHVSKELRTTLPLELPLKKKGKKKGGGRGERKEDVFQLGDRQCLLLDYF